MKVWLAVAGGLLPGALPGLAQETPAEAMLVVRVTGLESQEGRVRIGLYADEVGFPGLPTRAVEIDAGGAEVGGSVEWRVQVPPGRYAVAAVHDRNANGELDTNFLGMPREPFGFSNDARGRFGPPSFASAAVDVLAQRTELELGVR